MLVYLLPVPTAGGLMSQNTSSNTNCSTPTDRQCRDCGALPGEAHEENCDVALCLVTGEQRLMHKMMSIEHDCGRQIWTGEWPGVAECREFGWYVTGMPFVRCDPDAPGAMPDLNRLNTEALWDNDRKRWVLL